MSFARCRAANFRKHPRRFRVEKKSFVAMRLATVNIGLRRGIDQDVELQRSKCAAQLFQISEIELRMVEPDHVEAFSVFAHERRAQSATCSNNYDSGFLHDSI